MSDGRQGHAVEGQPGWAARSQLGHRRTLCFDLVGQQEVMLLSWLCKLVVNITVPHSVTFSDITLAAWNRWWEYLHHRDGQFLEMEPTSTLAGFKLVYTTGKFELRGGYGLF